MFAAHALNQILVFDDLHGYLDQKLSYSRELDDLGEVTEKIADKASAHYMDAERYIISYLRLDKPQATYSGSVIARPGLRNL